MRTDELRPNLLIVGAARSATTSLVAGLAQRGVCFTRPKEPHFWAFHPDPARFGGPGDDEMINRTIVTDRRAYEALFPPDARSAQWRGDGSVSTLYYAERSIPNIQRYADPDVRLICILREPTARALSAFRYMRSRGHEAEPNFFEAMRLEPERRQAGYHHMWHYQAMSRYAEQVPAFRHAFADRLHVVILEEAQAEPKRFSDDLCAFLGFDSAPMIELPRNVNQSGEPRSVRLNAVFNAVRRHPTIHGAAVGRLPRPIRERVRRANLVAAPRVDLGLVRPQFEADVAAVETLLGRRIEAWR